MTNRPAPIPENYQAGFSYLSWLAYPDEPDDRERFRRASGYLPLKANGIQPKGMPPPLANLKGGPIRMEEIFNSGYARITDRRLASAYVFLRLMEPRRNDLRHYTGCDYVAGDGERELNGKATRDLSASDRWVSLPGLEKNADPRNFRERVWRPSLPLLPMTLSLFSSNESLAELWNRLAGAPPSSWFAMDGPAVDKGAAGLIAEPDWVFSAIENARLLASTMPMPTPDEGFIVPFLYKRAPAGP